MDQTKRDSPEDLVQFAKALILKAIHKHNLEWDEYCIEDAVQELFLQGWKVWCDKKNVGLAKNRMVDRRKNVLRDYVSEMKHEPKPESEFEPIAIPSLEEGKKDREDWLEQRADIRGSPAEELGVRDYVDHLPQRRRDICRYRMAGYTNKEIAQEMGINERTVQRELVVIREDCKNEFQKH